MRTKILAISTIATAALPALASAQTIYNLLALINNVLNALIAILITMAVVVVFWGTIRAIFASGPDEKSKSWRVALNGVIAVAVMVSIWGIIRLLQNTLGVSSTAPIIPSGVQINPPR